ncbi:hypothetical protein ACROYT_G028934 [Oculina patagonica]
MQPSSDTQRASCLKNDVERHQYLARLLINGGTRHLREKFDSIHKPENLQLTLNDPAIKTKLIGIATVHEWHRLYPQDPAKQIKRLVPRLVGIVCASTVASAVACAVIAGTVGDPAAGALAGYVAGAAADELFTRITDVTKAPQEILARGPLALEIYNKALKEGKTIVRRLPIMMVGQERVGKTTLKKSLKGERFHANEESTRGIEVDPSHCKVTTEIWRPGKPNQTCPDSANSFDHHAAQLIARSLTKESLKGSKSKAKTGEFTPSAKNTQKRSPGTYLRPLCDRPTRNIRV